MTAEKAFRKLLQLLFAGGATLSAAILSFVGMLAITPSLFLSIGAIIFVFGFESQVNNKGTGDTLKSLFIPNHLKLFIVQDFLDHVNSMDYANNSFYKNYKSQKEYVEYLKNEMTYLKSQRDTLIHVYEAKKRDELRDMILIKKQELKKEKKELQRLQLFFLKKLYRPAMDGSGNALETAVAELIGANAQGLKKEISRKINAIRLCWLFSIMSGVSSGLSTLSALHSGIALFSVLSVIPGGALIGLSVVAAVGYMLLIQDTMMKVIQKYKQGWLEYYKRKENESMTYCYVRRGVLALAIVLAFAATVATAGTWFNLVNDGAKMLGALDKVANVVRNIFIIGMTLPTLIYNTENSLESINTLFKKDLKKQMIEMGRSMVSAFHEENIVRFLNPFRMAAKILSVIGTGFLFVCHGVSTGAGSDRIKLDFIPFMPTITPAGAIPIVGGNELATDAKFLQSKHSFLLSALFLIVRVPILILKTSASVWDCVFSKERNLKKSFEKMVLSQHKNSVTKPVEIAKPELSDEWHRQKLIESHDDTIYRLENENWIQKKFIYDEKKTMQKIEDAKKTKEDISRGFIDQDTAIRSMNTNRCRYTMWEKAQTRAAKDLDDTFESHPFFSAKAGA